MEKKVPKNYWYRDKGKDKRERWFSICWKCNERCNV